MYSKVYPHKHDFWPVELSIYWELSIVYSAQNSLIISMMYRMAFKSFKNFRPNSNMLSVEPPYTECVA